MAFFYERRRAGNNNREDEDPMKIPTLRGVPITLNYTGIELNFTTTDGGLINIVTTIHEDFCSRSSSYKTNISESMLLYYATIMLWYRKVHLASCNFLLGQASQEVGNFVKTDLTEMSYEKLPKLLALYYSGIGNITDPIGNLFRWNNVTWPNPDIYAGVSGYFGHVSDMTHVHYMNQLSPGIAAQRILEEMDYTSNTGSRNSSWDLPCQLRPSNQNAGLPTPNLLGYKLKEQLTSEQQSLLQSCGVTSNNDQRSFGEISNHTFCFNHKLFSKIHTVVNSLQYRRVKTEEMTDKETGSRCQIPYVVYSEENQLESAFNLCSEMVVAAMTFRYRTKILSSDSRARWAIYDFENYTQVPLQWKQTSNDYFVYGKADIWNYGFYETNIRNYYLDSIMMQVMTNEANFSGSSSD